MPAWAQQTGTAPLPSKTDSSQPVVPSPFAPLSKPISALSVEKKTVGEVATMLTKETGILVLADSTVSKTPVTFDVASLRLGEIADGIAKLVPGTTVRFIGIASDIPSPDPEMLSQILQLQDAMRVFSPAKQPVLTGPYSQIEIDGHLLPLAKAEPVLAALNLRPAFLLMNPGGDNPVARSARLQAEGLQAYLAMTPEQRQQAAERQMDNLLNMDSATRRALFGQMQQQAMAVMNKLNSLPPDQRAQFFRDITGGKYDGSTPLPGSGKGGPRSGRQ
jgi:hypothetical protein